MLRLVFLFTGSVASALTGVSGVPADFALYETAPSERLDRLFSPEIIDLGTNDPNGKSADLTPTFLGKSGITAQKILYTLAPQLKECQLRLISAQAGADERSLHERYQLFCRGFLVDRALLTLHHIDNRLSMVRARLPNFRLPTTGPSAQDFRPLADLKTLSAATLTQAKTEQVLEDSTNVARPAWHVSRHDEQTGRTQHWLIDAQTGAVLKSESIAFDFVNVYERSPFDSSLISTKLEGLNTSGFLDGFHFRILAPDENAPRAVIPFDYRPEDPEQAWAFDQVQVYYSAERILQWLNRRFAYDRTKVQQMLIRINGVINGNADNAQYVPPPQGPSILIGRGGKTLTQLARDSDVVAHEFMHHVIYEFVQAHRDESGIFHEGTADYFAYALNEDPRLAESTVIAGGPLRTALLPDTARFDSFALDRSLHVRGQVWSAMLWELRTQIGESFDRTVYESLPYLGPDSGFRDAIIGLLHADQALNRGIDRCRILEVAVRRGYAMVLGELDGSACGLDLADLAKQSLAYFERYRPPREDVQPTLEDGVRATLCGSIQDRTVTSQNRSWLAFVVLITPIMLWAKSWILKKS